MTPSSHALRHSKYKRHPKIAEPQGSTLSIELVAGLISSSQLVVELIARSEIAVELLTRSLFGWVTWWSIFVDLGAIAHLF